MTRTSVVALALAAALYFPIAGCGAGDSASSTPPKPTSKDEVYRSDKDAVGEPSKGIKVLVDLPKLAYKSKDEVNKVLGKVGPDGSHDLGNGVSLTVNFESGKATMFQVFSKTKVPTVADVLAPLNMSLKGKRPDGSGIGSRAFKDVEASGVKWEQISILGSPEEGGFDGMSAFLSVK
jgi:hypothetical protein